MNRDGRNDHLAVYRIRVKGLLDNRWSHWFDGLTIVPQADGDTVIAGPVVDQAALFGLLNKIRDIGLTLLSVNKTPDGDMTGD